MKSKDEIKWGEFCNIFGATPRNRIIEFFLEARELDYGIGDVAEFTGLNRATAYNVMTELIQDHYVVPTRKLSGAQLFKLNVQKQEVKLLIEVFNRVQGKITEEYRQKERLVAR